jgi:hypothetical protein
MSGQTQKYEVDAATASKDLQDVFTTIAINWRLHPTSATTFTRTLFGVH